MPTYTVAEYNRVFALAEQLQDARWFDTGRDLYDAIYRVGDAEEEVIDAVVRDFCILTNTESMREGGWQEEYRVFTDYPYDGEGS